MTTTHKEGERVVLGTRGGGMVKVKWTSDCPDTLNDLEYAEELGAKWEDDALVTYDYPGFTQLLEYYESDEYLPDND